MLKVLKLATSLSALVLPQLTTLSQVRLSIVFKQIMKNPENVLLGLSYVTWGASEVPIFYEFLECKNGIFTVGSLDQWQDVVSGVLVLCEIFLSEGGSLHAYAMGPILRNAK